MCLHLITFTRETVYNLYYYPTYKGSMWVPQNLSYSDPRLQFWYNYWKIIECKASSCHNHEGSKVDRITFTYKVIKIAAYGVKISELSENVSKTGVETRSFLVIRKRLHWITCTTLVDNNTSDKLLAIIPGLSYGTANQKK